MANCLAGVSDDQLWELLEELSFADSRPAKTDAIKFFLAFIDPIKVVQKIMATIVRQLTRRSPASLRTFQAFISQGSSICQENVFRRAIPALTSYNRRCFSAHISPASNAQHVTEPAQLSQSEYEKHSDAYIDSVVEALEELAESKPTMDVEYHSGVLNLIFPPAGTYVINKQPPNHQIWLSSPVSGPKRYDFVRNSDGKGLWVYLRDGSTLTELLKDELSLDFESPEGD